MSASDVGRWLVIDNAGRPEIGRWVAEWLGKRGLQVDHQRPDSRDDAQHRLRSCLDDIAGAVAVGGDGTVSALAQVLAGTDIPLLIVPAGTANDFARTLGLSTESDQALALLDTGTPRPVDLGVCDGRVFLNVAHVGWGALARSRIARREKGLLGVLSYGVGALRAWREHRPFRAVVRCGDTYMRLRVSHLSVANGRYFGGGMSVSPDAGPFDGLLQVVCLRHRPLWRVVWLGLLVALGRRPRGRDTVEASGGRVRLDTRRRHRVVADGEWLGHSPCEFRAWSGALRVFMPVSGAGAPRQ